MTAIFSAEVSYHPHIRNDAYSRVAQFWFVPIVLIFKPCLFSKSCLLSREYSSLFLKFGLFKGSSFQAYILFKKYEPTYGVRLFKLIILLEKLFNSQTLSMGPSKTLPLISFLSKNLFITWNSRHYQGMGLAHLKQKPFLVYCIFTAI